MAFNFGGAVTAAPATQQTFGFGAGALKPAAPAAAPAPAFSFGMGAPAAAQVPQQAQPAQQTQPAQQVQRSTKFADLPPAMQQQLVAIDAKISAQGRLLAQMRSTPLPDLMRSTTANVAELQCEADALQDQLQTDRVAVNEMTAATFRTLGVAEVIQRKLDVLTAQQAGLVEELLGGPVADALKSRAALAAQPRALSSASLRFDNEMVQKYYNEFYEASVARADQHQRVVRELGQSVAALLYSIAPEAQHQLQQEDPRELLQSARKQRETQRVAAERLADMHEKLCRLVAQLKRARLELRARGVRVSDGAPGSAERRRATAGGAGGAAATATRSSAAGNRARLAAGESDEWMPLSQVVRYLGTSDAAPAPAGAPAAAPFGLGATAAAAQPRPLSFGATATTSTAPFQSAAPTGSFGTFGGFGTANAAAPAGLLANAADSGKRPKPALAVSTGFSFGK